MHTDIYKSLGATKGKKNKGTKRLMLTEKDIWNWRTPDSGANVSRSSPQQQRRRLSISEEVSRKRNGPNKAEEGESSIWE